MTAPSPPERPDGTAQPPAWSPAQRLGFRFICIYFGLYLAPFPLGLIPLMGPVAGWYQSLWTAAARWVGPRILGLDVVVQPTGSGDTALAFTLMFVQLVVAALGTAIWTAVDRRRRRYDRAWDLLRVYVRFGLGTTMLSYGAFKIIPTQFPYPALVRLLEPLGNSSPMGLLWKFMGYSVPFSVFSGLGEFVGGSLLFFRRTATLGALVLITVMSTVVMMNYSYDVPVKLYSSHLLLMAGFLTLPDLRRLLDVLVFDRPTGPRNLGTLVPPGRLRVAVGVVKTLFVGWAVWSNLHSSYGFSRMYAQRPPLYGIYEVDRFVLNGDTLPPDLTDYRRWRRLIVDRGFGPDAGVATVQTMNGPLQGEGALRFRFAADTSARTFTLTSIADTADWFEFAFDPTPSDYLSAHGTWYGDTLQLGLRRFDETTFLLNSRGYHWISELPFNR